MKRTLTVLSVLPLTLSLLFTPANTEVQAASKPKPAKYAKGEVIVKFKSDTKQSKMSKVHKQEGAKLIKRNKTKKVKFDLVKVKGKSVKKAVKEYKKNPNVEYAEPNYIFRASWTPNDTYYQSYQYGPQKVKAPAAWDITRSSESTRIAVVDTGVQYNHPDLSGKVVRGYDYVDGDWDPNDGNGHGTHVAGTAAAVTNNSRGVAGMAPNATIYAVRVLNNSGSGTLSDVANGIIHAANNDSDVINLSLGAAYGSSTLENAVNYAWNKGAVVVAAAGNAGNTAKHYPAAYSNAISVAATDANDRKASFSTYGSWVDVAAPGVDILSTWPGGYRYLNGTSMAAPHVAGLAGLLDSQGRSNSNIRAAIENTADQISGTGSYWRKGRINAYRAVNY
ncbi:S8 family peptidase [Melghirimyces algeriensis]|uniref:Thermitase Serine peptidase. MEROPS family S08A n=1 Tax=Melghirimyces algeriensis TaxID=910412 RepID=A0A521EJU0_9BACL|nr:S8 family peptidase [Melghirimyces algeriensis]SMO84174.1 thermitase Serine peptidase. MEROPS family S08A [Melghirimyces algeriensis]